MKRFLSLFLLCCCLLGLCACGEQPAPAADRSGALAAPVYPSMAPRPNPDDYLKDNGWEMEEGYYTAMSAWRSDLQAMRRQPDGYAEGLEGYLAESIRQFLSGAEGENRVFSPLNLYMALAMLAEVTDGQSRQQILDLLGAASLEALREQAGALWRASYQNDGVTASVLASSLWLRQDMDYVPETLENLASYYYAYAFRGEMGSPDYDALLQGWLNEQTGGLLQEQAAGLHMEPKTVLALVTSIYFKAPWINEFQAYFTEDGSFFGPDGEEQVPFLHGSREIPWYWGAQFSAVGLGMENGGDLWFLLPEEGVTPEALLQDAEAMDFLLLRNKGAWAQQKTPLVHLTIPKLDVSSDLELSAGLQAMGLTEVFDSERSDFTPLTRDVEELYVSRVQHAARVKIDEEGCEAAAYTEILVAAEEAELEEPEPEEVYFVLDRPFLFVLTNADGLPLFVGLVNHPAE
ncbi:MAG: hypothetical protein IJK63_08315 [Oscillospiraceae bacterium]|nr:hypothetical protein [Oscillospiraceae bacterium]